MLNVDGPSKKVLSEQANDVETKLKIRAWEVAESPIELRYRMVKGWPKLPTGWKLGPVASVAADSQERYYIFHRGDKAPPLMCFNKKGEYLYSWGEGEFVRPHRIYIDDEDNLWLIDEGGHILYYFTPEGELLNKLGTKGVPGKDGTHFYRPTDITAGLNGQFYVSDGYGNKRVARFNKDLNFIGQWGSEGEGEGQFVLPHAITTDPEGLVYVCDRNRWRVQIFTSEGEYLTQWTHIGKAYQIVYTPDNCFFICDGNNSRVWKLEKSGKIIGFFSSRTPEVVARGETTVHDMALAPNGDILLAHLDGVVQLFSPNSMSHYSSV
ncbi:MAG: peptidyl-alpha-hydroxyglycine alpha-amidating lyase family protein [Promethearchaeota archaeon]